MRHPFILALLLALSGCAVIQPPQPPSVSDNALQIPRAPLRKGASGGVFVSENALSLTADRRALRPGDVLTVALEETTRASKKADTQFGKGSSLSVDPTLLRGKLLKTDIGVSSNADFSGTASSSQQNMLLGAITVVVHEVMPNGLLRVEGEKNLYLNQGEEMVRLSGYVRPEDIDNENQLSSLRVANARIVYAGRGTLADANNAGWLSRFFVNPWMPF